MALTALVRLSQKRRRAIRSVAEMFLDLASDRGAAR